MITAENLQNISTWVKLLNCRFAFSGRNDIVRRVFKIMIKTLSKEEEQKKRKTS